MPFHLIRRWFHTVAIRKELFTLLRDAEMVSNDDYLGHYDLMKKTTQLLSHIVVEDVFENPSDFTISVKTKDIASLQEVLRVFPSVVGNKLILEDKQNFKVSSWLNIYGQKPSEFNQLIRTLAVLLTGALETSEENKSIAGRKLRGVHDDVITFLHLLSEIATLRKKT